MTRGEPEKKSIDPEDIVWEDQESSSSLDSHFVHYWVTIDVVTYYSSNATQCVYDVDPNRLCHAARHDVPVFASKVNDL